MTRWPTTGSSYYQPQYETGTDRSSVPRLLAFRNQQGRRPGPAWRLPHAAEENGLIIPINEWVCAAPAPTRIWQRAGLLRFGGRRQHVPIQFRRKNVPLQIARILSKPVSSRDGSNSS